MKSGRHAFSGVVRSLCATLPFMNKETLLAELNRLLDAGEPLLDVFPKRQGRWSLQLPDSISPEMEWYADSVALRAWDRKDWQDWRLRNTTSYLAESVKICEVGLLGWRAIGVLK